MRESVSTLDSTIEVLDEFLQIAGKKYETGRGLQQDLFRIETERARMQDKRAAFSQMASTTGKRLAFLMGRDPMNVPRPPVSIPDSFDPVAALNLDSLLIADNPALESTRKGIEITNRQVDLKKSLWWPNLNLNAGYGYRQDADNGMARPDFFTITAGMSVPIFGSSKQGAAVEEPQAVSRQVQASYSNQVLKLRFNLQALLDEDSRLEEQISIYENDVIPQATATISASLSTYSVGKTDIEALLMAEMSLFNSRLGLMDRNRKRVIVRTKLAALVGSADLVKTD